MNSNELVPIGEYARAFWEVWSRQSIEGHEARVWRRLAYATRYGHIPLSEALSLGTYELLQFNNALNDIVGEENKPRS